MRFGIFTTNAGFIMPVVEAMKRRGHEILVWPQTGNPNVNWTNLQRILDRCDVAYFEWSQEPFLQAMTIESLSCKVALREHGLPFFGLYKTFPWDKVDLFIGAELFCRMLQEVTRRPKSTLNLPVGSDPFLFTMPKDRQYGRNLVTHATSVRFKKRVYTTIQSFYDLLQWKNPAGWKLHIVGDWEGGYTQNSEGIHYTGPCRELIEDLKLSTRIQLQPNMPLETWKTYLGDKDVFISNGIRESTNVSCVESMMCGVYPLVNCWKTADVYYPQECVFKSQRELVDKVLEWDEKPEKEKLRLSQEMREWAVERFDNRKIGNRIVEELELL